MQYQLNLQNNIKSRKKVNAAEKLKLKNLRNNMGRRKANIPRAGVKKGGKLKRSGKKC